MGVHEWWLRQKAAYGRYKRFYRSDGPTQFDEMLDFFDDMEAYPSVQWRWENAKARVRRIVWDIRDLPFETRCAYQRVRYGVSVKDTWSLDYHLARVIAQGMDWLDERDVLDRSSYQEDWALVKEYMRAMAADEIDYADRVDGREAEALQAFTRIFASLWE